MKLSKKNDPVRKWRSIKRHCLLLIRASALASAITFLWYELWIRGCHFPEDVTDIIVGAIITTLGVTYGILVSWILNSIWEKYQKVVISVLKRDKDTFLLYRDERMPIAFHLLIGIVSFPLIGMIGMVAYKHVMTGVISVFAISLVLAAFWLVIAQIEDPTKGGWFLERIPPEWLPGKTWMNIFTLARVQRKRSNTARGDLCGSLRAFHFSTSDRAAAFFVVTRSFTREDCRDTVQKAELKHSEARMPSGDNFDRLRQALQTAQTENAAKEKEIQELVDALKEAHQELEKVRKVPWLSASVIRILDPQARYVEVSGGRIVYAAKKSVLTGDPIELESLQLGQHVYVAKEAYLIHVPQPAEFQEIGDVLTFESVLSDRTIVAATRDAKVVIRPLATLKVGDLKQGDHILVNGGFAIGRVDLKRLEEMVLKVNRPKKDFSMARGLDAEIRKISEYLINPFLDGDAAKLFQLKVATQDDFMLCGIFHGPPGCGKTLLGEATATELEKDLRRISGDGFKVGFILVRGPELLNKWLGNTEEMMRELLLKKTAEFDPSFILWDEFGAMFPPRGMNSNAPWVANHVAQFNSLIGSFRAEKRKAILIAADNRVDQIDPAVIRAGRFDFRLHVPRPGPEGAEQILELYLPPDLPLHYSVASQHEPNREQAIRGIRERLIEPLIERMYDPDAEGNQLIEVSYAGGKEILGFKDLLVSGAVIESIAERAKVIAFNEWIEKHDAKERGIRFEHLVTAFEEDIASVERLPTAEKALDDWLETEGIDVKSARTRFLKKGHQSELGFTSKKQ